MKYWNSRLTNEHYIWWKCFDVCGFVLVYIIKCMHGTGPVFTLKKNMEVVRRTFNSENVVKVRAKTNKSKVYLFTI